MNDVTRPHVLLSVAVSLDGCIDDATPRRLVLSGPEDLDRVDAVRAASDAILVGAGTVRADDPRLLVRSAARRAERVARGLPDTPVKVTVTRTGGLDPAAAFFTAGDGEKLVYAATPAVEGLRGLPATVVDAGDPPDLAGILADLAARGIERLMVEGGTAMHTLFLGAGVVDELHVAVCPLLVGSPDAPRFVRGEELPAGRMRLVEVRQVGDVVLLVYRP
ncbi:RibD family protein [Pseudonocardia sp.]|uniref:RibD family protein n=1 Tax=Pseudonocardia sp. TaxID=60912 RepID=UPI003D0AD7A2